MSRTMWGCLLWSLSLSVAAQQQEQFEPVKVTAAVAGAASAAASSLSTTSLRGAAASPAHPAKQVDLDPDFGLDFDAPDVPLELAEAEADSPSSSYDDVGSSSELIPAVYAEYHAKGQGSDGEYEITVHEIPVQKLDDGLEMDPWMQLALSEGVDLNEYNVTYEGGTWETLEEDHRRNLVSVSGIENNNGRYCSYARQQKGLNQLSWRADLIQQAKKQAAYMARVRHIEHRSYLATGISAGWRVITENVCQNVNIGYGGAFTSLMNDQGHRLNILHPGVKNVGVGIVRNGPYYYMCQIFLG